MSAPPVPLFLNPAAGRRRAGKRAAHIVQLLQQSGVPVELQQSTAVADLERRVFEACTGGTPRIIVAGGDGSIHEAVNGILRAGGKTRLGVIPSGTGNDFAKACDISLDWPRATTALAQRMQSGRPARRIDVGRMNERYFANGAGIGFDARVTKVARSYRWPIGDFVYLLAILRCLADGIATPSVTISAGDLQWQGPLTLASISNGAWIGGMFHIAPMAANNDGTLELMIADPVTRRRILSLLPKLMSGDHVSEREIQHHPVTALTVTAEEPLPSHLDGEVQPLQRHFDIKLLPNALRLL